MGFRAFTGELLAPSREFVTVSLLLPWSRRVIATDCYGHLGAGGREFLGKAQRISSSTPDEIHDGLEPGAVATG